VTRLVFCPGVCRECSCTELEPCVLEDGTTCAWAEPDLCTACAGEDLDDVELLDLTPGDL